jgi:hypothetical protein
MKDEALTPAGFKMEDLPIAKPSDETRKQIEQDAGRMIEVSAESRERRRAVLDWLRHEFGVEKASQKLQALDALAPDDLIAEVKKARGRAKPPLSVADVKRLKDEHANSVTPLRALAAEAHQLERRVSDLVNAAYGLTPAEVALLWETAPPRTPLATAHGQPGVQE